MNISIYIPKWLAWQLARPKQPPAVRPNLKQRQPLPTLPKACLDNVRFQDDDSPAGYRIHWRL